MELVFALTIPFFVFVGGFALIRAGWRMTDRGILHDHGALRGILMLPPLGFLAMFSLTLVQDWLVDPTAQNLWPITCFLLGITFMGYVGVICVLSLLAGWLLDKRPDG